MGIKARKGQKQLQERRLELEATINRNSVQADWYRRGGYTTPGRQKLKKR